MFKYKFCESTLIWKTTKNKKGKKTSVLKKLETNTHGDIVDVLSLRIQSECGKIRTRITPNMDTIQAVLLTDFSWINLRNCSMVYFETEFVLTKAKFASFHIGLVMTGLAIVNRSSRIELFWETPLRKLVQYYKME